MQETFIQIPHFILGDNENQVFSKVTWLVAVWTQASWLPDQSHQTLISPVPCHLPQSTDTAIIQYSFPSEHCQRIIWGNAGFARPWSHQGTGLYKKELIQIYENLWSKVLALLPHLKDDTILYFSLLGTLLQRTEDLVLESKHSKVSDRLFLLLQVQWDCRPAPYSTPIALLNWASPSCDPSGNSLTWSTFSEPTDLTAPYAGCFA